MTMLAGLMTSLAPLSSSASSSLSPFILSSVCLNSTSQAFEGLSDQFTSSGSWDGVSTGEGGNSMSSPASGENSRNPEATQTSGGSGSGGSNNDAALPSANQTSGNSGSGSKNTGELT
jgi:hypothetical protein